jgi:hypothetical protein
VLRTVLIARLLSIALVLLIALPILAGAGVAAASDAPADSSQAAPEPWYVRNITRWFTRPDPAITAVTDDAVQRAEIPFMPFAIRPIRRVEIISRKAFGTIVPDSTGGPAWLVGAARLTASPIEGALNDLYAGTRDVVIAQHLLFRAGDRLDPFALADSERLLREVAFINDARIEVVPADADTAMVDVFVFVRDRWPYGADLKIHGAGWYDLELFHRNVVGRGLDLEVALRVREDLSSDPGYASQLRATNIGGSFVDAAVFVQEAWDRDERRFAAAREFRHLDVRLVGGLGLTEVTDHTLLGDPLASDVAWRAQEAWVGRAFVVDQDLYGARPRLRVVPAAGVFDVRYHARPDPSRFPDATLVLGAATLVGWESYRTHLVRGFGETEDIPAGVWLSLVGGWEHGEVADRPYHGLSLVVPTFSASGRYLAGRFAWGGYRRGGRLEDGVVQAEVGGFSSLHGLRRLRWRHAWVVGYTRGLNRSVPGGLGLDDVDGVRGLDRAEPRGDERLHAGVETVAFLPPSLLGFKFALFGFADGGFIGPGREPLLDQPLYASFGGGLRVKNPGLVFPTLQVRVARVRDDDDWRTEIALESRGDSFFDFLVPGVRPAILPYR